MPNRSVSVMRRKGSNNHSYVRRIPVDVRERMAGRTFLVPIGAERVPCTIGEKTMMIRLSLRTPIPAEAKLRMLEVEQFFEQLWTSLRTSRPVSLTHRQCVALAGDVFRVWADSERGRVTAIESETMKPGTAWHVSQDHFYPPDGWQSALAHLEERSGGGEAPELEPFLGPAVDHVLHDRGIAEVDEPSRALLLQEVYRALRDGFVVQKRQAAGDYSPAPEQNRFPEWQAPSTAPVAGRKGRTEAARAPAGKLSLRGLVDSWWAEAKPAGRALSTFDSYNATVNRLATFLKHDDARAVTNADVVRFKDHRVANGASLKTVKDSDLAGLRSIFGFAVGNGLLKENPADGIRVLRPKKARTRAKGFTAEEAAAILAKTLAHVPAANEKPQMTAAKRWVPWLCAYTGARVGELVQLRKEDVRQVEGFWTITITPEAGTVKDKDARTVVLHPHLVELGFPAFAGASKPGPLFLAVKAGSTFEELRGKWRAAKNRLAESAREVVPDVRVSPNHGWRHLFKTKGREAGIADSVLDAIGGWEPDTVGGDYGDVSLQAQAAAFEKFPKFEVAGS